MPSTDSGPRHVWAKRMWVGILAGMTIALPSGFAEADQEGRIEGRVWSEDGVAVEGAVVWVFPVADSADVRSDETDPLGHFSFRDLSPGVQIVAVARIGFAEQRERVEVRDSGHLEMEIVLVYEAIELPNMEVRASRSRARARFEGTAGTTVQEMGRAALKAIPGVAESDPLRAVGTLPGVTTVSDFAAAFNVRGGSADQNLVLLDDVPIYNPFHLARISHTVAE